MRNTYSMLKPIPVIYSSSGEYLLGLQHLEGEALCNPTQYSEYTILLITQGKGIFQADFGAFPFTAPALLFATPLQVLHLRDCINLRCVVLQFHGDFYCIEYHRKEVACNGLLFNNIYLDPIISLSDTQSASFSRILKEMEEEARLDCPSEIVIRSYLQLFLAKSSSIKMRELDGTSVLIKKDEQMEKFRQLLDQHYLNLRKPADYASLLAMTPDNFTRRSQHYFKKTPSQLIQERLVLEAKKQLHLTRQSIKEIAFNLKFQDEFYFSRFFKKITKVSPQAFRDRTGISIVADLPKS
ncbi:helix-turn-helix domain-containing protein [Desertivirga brevis]|uniref:helix-turn-helix domain-containing protein n=1 Tax=Desertivirga brevis TaxID=2810310 RepID=UPI001A96A0EB|nr:helix-turn-helix domain-containing protein [Pedobacter sp. SYSU D00873]